MPSDMREAFVWDVYNSLHKICSEEWGSTAYMPTAYTREFHLVQNMMEPSVPIPSIFSKEDVAKVLADIPEHEYGDYEALKYAFIIQFCWKEPEKKHGFFKIRPKYPWQNDVHCLFKLNPVPMICTEDVDWNVGKAVNSLLKIMETI